MGAIENSTDFGHRIHAEAAQRGLANAERVAILSDGAACNTTIAQEHFPDAIHILDLYHARERLAAFTRDTLPAPLNELFHRAAESLLDAGELSTLVEQLGQALARGGPRRAEGKRRIAYFRANAESVRDGEFHAMRLFGGKARVLRRKRPKPGHGHANKSRSTTIHQQASSPSGK